MVYSNMTSPYLIPCLKKLVGLGDFLRVSHLTSSLEMVRKIHRLPCKRMVRCSKLYPPWKPMDCISCSYKNGCSMGFHIPHCSFQYVVKVALGIIQVAKWCKVMSRIHLKFGNTMINKWPFHEKNDRHQMWFVFP